jgi:hypothetical protein
MSYILYASIARAGGLDLFLGTEAVSHPPLHRRVRRTQPSAGLRLRRVLGRGLLRLGQAIAARGARWAAVCSSETLPQLKTAN